MHHFIFLKGIKILLFVILLGIFQLCTSFELTSVQYATYKSNGVVSSWKNLSPVVVISKDTQQLLFKCRENPTIYTQTLNSLTWDSHLLLNIHSAELEDGSTHVPYALSITPMSSPDSLQRHHVIKFQSDDTFASNYIYVALSTTTPASFDDVRSIPRVQPVSQLSSQETPTNPQTFLGKYWWVILLGVIVVSVMPANPVRD